MAGGQNGSNDQGPGTQEPVDQQGATQTPVAPAVDAPPPQGTPAPVPSQAPSEPSRPAPDWRDRRIGEQQARIRDLRAQLERFQQQAQGQQPPPQQPPRQVQPYQGGPPDPAAVEREIQQRAEALAATQEFNRRCNETAEAGRAAFPDFDTRVSKLVGLVDGNDPTQVQNYNQFLSAAMETGEASKLIYTLGGDLNEASRLLSLSPLKMAVELTKMSGRPMQEMSSAPRPINPAGSAMGMNGRAPFGADDPNSDNLSTEEWMRRREEQVAERRRNGGR